MGKLDGKIALVTGGNSGIGLATAKLFVKEGAYVFITGRCEAELSAASKEIGRNVTSVQGDVSKLDDLDRLFAQIKQQKGKLDVVFANAGIAQFAPHISRRCQPAIPVVAVYPVPLKIIPNLENRFVVSPAIKQMKWAYSSSSKLASNTKDKNLVSRQGEEGADHEGNRYS